VIGTIHTEILGINYYYTYLWKVHKYSLLFLTNRRFLYSFIYPRKERNSWIVLSWKYLLLTHTNIQTTLTKTRFQHILILKGHRDRNCNRRLTYTHLCTSPKVSFFHLLLPTESCLCDSLLNTRSFLFSLGIPIHYNSLLAIYSYRPTRKVALTNTKTQSIRTCNF